MRNGGACRERDKIVEGVVCDDEGGWWANSDKSVEVMALELVYNWSELLRSSDDEIRDAMDEVTFIYISIGIFCLLYGINRWVVL